MLPDYPALEVHTATVGAAEFPLDSYFSPTSPKIQELRAKYETLHAIESELDFPLHGNCRGNTPTHQI